MGVFRSRKSLSLIFEENRLLGNYINPGVETLGKSTEDVT